MWWTLALAGQPLGQTVELDPLDLLEDDVGVLPEVVGGRVVAREEYAEAVGIVFYGQYVGCTGTLVAPNVVVTAGHCLDDLVTHVVVGATNWEEGDAEALVVEDYWTHPSYQSAYSGFDIGVIKLRESSTYPHRVIANGCVLDEVEDGTPATIVGYGSTQVDGGGRTKDKHVVETLVVDADCSEDVLNGVASGCQSGLRPGGEMGAGGRLDVDGDGEPDGARDACFGDSGGPLYVHTKFGTHVMGVTSRAFLGVASGFPCRDGSVWTRPDAVMDFLEGRTGVTLDRPVCNIPPELVTEELVVKQGRSIRYKPEVVDVDSDDFSVEVVTQGRLGETTVRGRTIVYDADKESLGPDVVRIRITDDGTFDGKSSASAEFDLVIEVVERDCGCESSPSLGWWPSRR